MANGRQTGYRAGAIGADANEMAPRINEFRRTIKVFFGRKIVIGGTFIILVLILTAIFAPQLAPYDPNKMNMRETLVQPSREHLLGTDHLGRDTLSRIIYGTRTSLAVCVAAVFVSGILGISMGLIAGYFGGIVYAVIMRFVDTLMSLPMIFKALILVSVFGGGLHNLALALGISMSASVARVTCGQCLSIKQNDYVLASRAIGVHPLLIMIRHILPNGFAPILVMLTMELGRVILAETSLSFLGMGIPPPVAAWGAMISEGRMHLLTNPILSFAPGVAIALVVFAFNMAGDGLRDALDPRLRGLL